MRMALAAMQIAALLLAFGTSSALGAQAASSKADPSGVRVDRVEFEGNQAISSDALVSALELAEGESLERANVVRSAENIQKLYRLSGYFEAGVRSELMRRKVEGGSTLESVVKFVINEGLPTRVARVQVESVALEDPGLVAYWNQIKDGLVARAGISVGDVFSQERVGNSRRLLQDALASDEFVGAKVDDVKVTPDAAQADSNGSAAHWVSLVFRVDPGDRVVFGFRGNEYFSKTEIVGWLKELRQLGLGKDYIAAVKARVETEYRNVGYSSVIVTPYTFENRASHERRVTYQIEEGIRLKVSGVDFDGNQVFKPETLRAQFFQRASRPLQKGIYIERDVEAAGQLLVEWLKSEGFLSAKLVTVNRVISPVEPTVRLVVYLYEGEQTLVRSVRVDGARVFSETEVAKILKVATGAPLNLFAFSAGIDALKASYRAKGYLGMSIVNEDSEDIVAYSAENRTADIQIEINEGPAFKVSRIEVDGATTTATVVVLRELAFAPEEVLEEGKVFESEARLRKLGIFGSVAVRTSDDPERPGYKIVRVVVQEGDPGIVAGGFGVRNDLGLRVFSQAAYSNLFGHNHTASANLSFNRRFINFHFAEFELRFGYLWPWFTFGDTTFRPDLVYSQQQFLRFDTESLLFTPSLEKRLIRAINLTGTLTYSLERTRQFNSQAKIDDQVLTIGALIPGLKMDLRDHPLTPTSGIFATSTLEVASPWLFSQSSPFPVGYVRYQGRIDGFIPLGRDLTWYLSMRVGHAWNGASPVDGNAQSGQIPVSKQFTLGGLGSLRFLREQGLRVSNVDCTGADCDVQNVAIRGTLSYVNYRTQLDFPVSGNLRLGPFLDVGNLVADKFTFTEFLRYGAGFGVRYRTPVGPISFDWGFNLRPDEKAVPKEDNYQFYFSVGVI